MIGEITEIKLTKIKRFFIGLNTNSFEITNQPLIYLLQYVHYVINPHTHVSVNSSLVVVESGLFSVLTMMMYTHPVSSHHSISCLLPLLPVYYDGVS